MTILMAVAICLAAFADVPANAEQIKLTFATNSPPSGLKGDAEKIFIEELEKASNGKIKVEPFWAESLLSIRELMKGIADGMVDLGYVNIAYYPKRLVRNSGILLLDQGPVSYKQKLAAFKRIYTEIPELAAEIEGFNQKIIYTYTISPVGWCFTKPVKGIADINNLKIRASSRWALSVLKDLGATPVSLPWGDVYIALQTNSIQGVVTNLDSIHRAKLHEVAKNILLTDQLWSPIAYFININQDKWNKLPEDLKKAFQTAAANAESRFSEKYDQWLRIIREDIAKAGCTITEASQADIDLWLNSPKQQENIQTWIKEVSGTGIQDAQLILDRMQQIVQEEIRKEKS